MTFADPATGQRFPQHICTTCFDAVLQPYPEVSRELKDAQTEHRPAQIGAFPSELIPESFQTLMRKRR
jgi:hypothetical protein